ncbi:hypothetical protein EDWATA_01702 [Edwardsiella tarda ATCC 23685]|uniref:Uncharacterized protein n=1 Tax=Edwardsiella tarda ATCC 23685 TaxID=500638 RepID=D4F4M9_EDWTA|nr:hypothetical protein EDWATA_01702 [Edwardsiella tarda ATCC 23685]
MSTPERSPICVDYLRSCIMPSYWPSLYFFAKDYIPCRKGSDLTNVARLTMMRGSTS